MNEPKKIGGIKSLKVKTAVVFEGGSKSNGEYLSNAPHARTPATPVQTAVSVADELGRIAELCHDQGSEVALGVVTGAHRAWEWKGGEGYERGENPAKVVLSKLAEGQGYHLVPFFERNGLQRFQDNFQRDVEESREGHDYEAIWDKRWKEIILNEDGTVNLDQVKRELSDFWVMASFYQTVLEHVTGGRVSKLFTWPSVINSVADDIFNERVEDEVKDLQAELDRATEIDLSDTNSIYDVLLLVGHDIPIGVIPEWTDDQKQQAVAWAQAAHYKASDNHVAVPPYPEFLAPYKGDLDLSAFNHKD